MLFRLGRGLSLKLLSEAPPLEALAPLFCVPSELPETPPSDASGVLVVGEFSELDSHAAHGGLLISFRKISYFLTYPILLASSSKITG
jgi:hypothetical protein